MSHVLSKFENLGINCARTLCNILKCLSLSSKEKILLVLSLCIYKSFYPKKNGLVHDIKFYFRFSSSFDMGTAISNFAGN